MAFKRIDQCAQTLAMCSPCSDDGQARDQSGAGACSEHQCNPADGDRTISREYNERHRRRQRAQCNRKCQPETERPIQVPPD